MDSLSRQDNRRDVRRTLERLPKELDHTYDDAMVRIRDQDRQKASRANQVLTWICYAFRPLKVKELLYALAVEPGDDTLDEEAIPAVDDLIDACAGLVTVDEESKIVRLVHYTTQEYFESRRAGYFPDAQMDISKTCITYLSMKTFTNAPHRDLKSLVLENPLLHYAAMYWGDHVRGDPELLVLELILDFFHQRPNISLSMQVMNGLFDYYSYDVKENTDGLCVAAVFGLNETARHLLEKGPHPNGQNGSKQAALEAAAAIGHHGIVEILLSAGADVNGSEELDLTALHQAARYGNDDIVRTLLKNGADVDARCIDEETPLHVAVRHSHEDAVSILLAHHADVAAQNADGSTAIHFAVENGNLDMVLKLLEHGARASIEERDEENNTVLNLAAGLDSDYAIIKLLLDAGANTEAIGGDGDTPLVKALTNGRKDTVELLLDYGANPNAVTKDGLSMLRLIGPTGYDMNPSLELEELLLEHGAIAAADSDEEQYQFRDYPSQSDEDLQSDEDFQSDEDLRNDENF
jgi:ankyrin repeat protein